MMTTSPAIQLEGYRSRYIKDWGFRNTPCGAIQKQYDHRFLKIDQIRISKAWDPVPWTTFEKGELQLGPAVVEPGEPDVLKRNLFFSYEIPD